MKRIISLVFILCSFGCPAQAQLRPLNFELLKKNNTDKSSPLYYPALLARYTANDTTLTADEYRQLYYGSAFIKGYDAYGEPDQKDELKKLFSKDQMTDEEIKKAISLEKASLKSFPFRLRTLDQLSRLYELQKDSVSDHLVFIKISGLIGGMATTGNAQVDSMAMSVISVADEYTIINLLGLEFGNEQRLGNYKGHPIDIMALKNNDTGLKALYFDVSILFNSMSGMFDKKKN